MEGGKKVRVNLPIEQRLSILEEQKTSNLAALAAKYKVHPSTIRRIKRNATQIVDFANKLGAYQNRKRLRLGMFKELEDRLVAWFTEMVSRENHVTDASLLQKATELKNDMGLQPRFKVSRSWLGRFKRRHGIRLTRQPVTVDRAAAVKFVEDFKALMRRDLIRPENVYDMTEATLSWRLVTLQPNTSTEEERRKAKKNKHKYGADRIKIVLCSNASGTHKLTPMVIDHCRKPPKLIDAKDSLPVIFKTEPKAMRMSQMTFVQWYRDHFEPSVREYRKKRSLIRRTILLLDSARREDVQAAKLQESEGFQIMYLPQHTEALLQPMALGIVKQVKALYRRMIDQKAEAHRDMDTFQQRYTLKDCIGLLNDSWKEIKVDVIREAWRRIIPRCANGCFDISQDGDSFFVEEMSSDEDDVDFASDCEIIGSTLTLEEDSEVENEEVSVECGRQQQRGEDEISIKDEPIYVKQEHVKVAENPKSSTEEQTNATKEQTNVKQDELRYLLQRLDCYVSREVPFVQEMFQVLRNQLLGKHK